MSEATATATAIPREINLGLQKPVATPAYTRRFKSQSQTTETISGTQATITLDTAQPGSFIDTLDSYLSFTLRLTNTSTTKGYNVSFSSCGAQGLIRAMRIYVQGVPIEEITEYNALVEWLHDLSGIPDYCDRSAKSRYLANTMMDDHYVYLPPKSADAGATDSIREIQIQLPLISGVLGTMADKMFPSMLVAPGNCYIQLDMATAQNALRIQEVDVSSLVVATGGINTAATATPPLLATTAAVTGTNGVVVDVQAANPYGLMPNGADILNDRPYDAPYAACATDFATGKTHTGVITTEERIGGGIWGGASAQPGGGTFATFYQGVVMADDTTAPSATPGAGLTTTAAVTTNTSTGTPNSAIFLGNGVNEGGALQTVKKVNASTPTVNYSILNLEYIGKQVVVGDDVARAIIERAAAGDISIHTQSYRQYSNTISLNSWKYRVDPSYNLPATELKNGNPLCNLTQRYSNSVTQSIIIPAKISSANAIYHIFRNGVGIEDFQFDSLRRMTVGFTDGPGANSSSTTAQLRIGNELIPQSPIQSASEALQELLKAHHMDGFYGTCEKMGSLVAASEQLQWPQAGAAGSVGGLLQLRNATGNTATTFLAREYSLSLSATKALAFGGVGYVRNDFNSQILCPNPDSVTFVYGTPEVPAAASNSFIAGPLVDTGGCAYQFYRSAERAGAHVNFSLGGATAATIVPTYVAESPVEYANRIAQWRLAVRKAFFGYADERSEHQIKDPSKRNFLNPYKQHTGRYSTFMLGFDLDTFSHNSETIRSGHYLGNNTVSLNLTGAEFVDNSPLNQALCSSVRMDTYVLHDLRLSFQAGGIVQAFY